MAEILKVFTPEQIYNMMRDYLIAQGIGLTNFNEGSRTRSLLEAFAIITSVTGFDYSDGLRRSIPVAMYDGFGFKKKSSDYAYGYFRFYRRPKMTVSYIGTGTSAKLTITGTELSIVVSDKPADDITLDFATYEKTSDLVTAIDAHSAYSAMLVEDVSATLLYHYTNANVLGRLTYERADGIDIMAAPAAAVSIPEGVILTVDALSFVTLAASSIPEGEASSAYVHARCTATGLAGNIGAESIDTAWGSGSMTSTIIGVEYVVNDSSFAGGTDEESEVERQQRFKDYLAGLNGATANGIKAAVLGVQGVKSCTVRERYPQRGQCTIVADDGTGQLSTQMQEEILKVLNGDPSDYVNYPGFRAAGIPVNVVGPNVTPVNVTVTVYRVGTTYDADDIRNRVKTAIEQYVNTLRLGQNVIVFEIARVAKSAHSAVYDLLISDPTVNIPIDAGSVARTGSGTGGVVTVNLITYPTEP